MKNPYDTEDISELRNIAFYWMQKAKDEHMDKLAFMDFILERGWAMSLYDLNQSRKKIRVQEENNE